MRRGSHCPEIMQSFLRQSLASLFGLHACRRTRSWSLLERFSAAMQWVHDRSGEDAGIQVSDKNTQLYPEVSGYLIPTLLNWGERPLARQYADWLLRIQHMKGYWTDPAGKAPYTFDTAQILKGLLAIDLVEPGHRDAITRGCDWLVDQITPEGEITTPDQSQWKLRNGKLIPQAIQLYSLQPLREAGSRFGIDRYLDTVDKALQYYLKQPGVTAFDTLSHFHAYIIEALVDLGYLSDAKTAMKQIESLQDRRGYIPAYHHVRWTCSTGMLQYALIWYKLGEHEKADRTYEAACRLQNNSGGFYGGYGRGNIDYFPGQEISWAVKYFLDALDWKIRASFSGDVGAYPESIPEDDGRFKLLLDTIQSAKPRKILDIGCGRGRYLRNIIKKDIKAEFFGLDISEDMLKSMPSGITPLHGSIRCIPAPDDQFDCVICIEVLEHAVAIRQALREIGRVLAPGGTLILIDKNQDANNQFKLPEWEQWFDMTTVRSILEELGLSVDVHESVPYIRAQGPDNLFTGWIAVKE
jgi:malonyl-CoA O-methyltransferase